MSSVSQNPGRSRYEALRLARPAWFTTQPGDGIELLLDDNDIAAAEQAAAQRLLQKGEPAEWATVGVVYEDSYIRVLRDAVRFPTGDLGTYLRVMHTGSKAAGVAVLPRWRGRFLLVDHFRHATRSWLLECPRGFADDLEPEEAARTELREEIEADTIRLQSLGIVYADSGMLGAPVHLFLADVDHYGEGEKKEAIRAVVPFSFRQIHDGIAQGDITDSFTIMAFTRAWFLKLIDEQEAP
jgi:ADP-ribose pyrophosphatase